MTWIRSSSDVLVHERRRKNPPERRRKGGLEPLLGVRVPQAGGVRNKRLSQRRLEGTHGGQSRVAVDLDSQVLANTASFYVEGLEDRATTLKLKGHFNGPSDPASGKARFNQVAEVLLERSIAGDFGHARAAIQSDEDFVLTIHGTRIERKTEPYPNQAGFELSFVLSRANAAV